WLGEHAGALNFAGAVEALRQVCGNDTAIGTTGPVEHEAILFRAAASLSFPPSDIAAITERQMGNAPGWPVEMQVNFLGLYGPASPLPVVWTEDIVQDADGAQNLRDFLDVFDHPLIALAYRIARHYRIDRHFHAALEKGAPQAVIALAGQFAGTALARTVDWHRLLPFIGLLAHTSRSREILVEIVSGYFEIPVAVEEWMPRLVPIPPDQQFALGAPQSTLGSGTVLGEGVPDVAGAITLLLGPMPRAEFEAFLPQGAKRQELQAVVRMTLRQPIECFVDLLLDPVEAGGLVLGGAQLGWTTWQAGGDGPYRCPTGVLV
ncbi:MAG TPA: type VI secretion system baseplate subunit TssG, partial [Rhodanobacter sp.]